MRDNDHNAIWIAACAMWPMLRILFGKEFVTWDEAVSDPEHTGNVEIAITLAEIVLNVSVELEIAPVRRKRRKRQGVGAGAPDRVH
jgi:hypothetical protein